MKVYSLYLSTLTGYVVAATFTATITTATNLLVSAISQGALIPGQYVLIGNSFAQILYQGSGTAGSTGNYTLATNQTINATSLTYNSYAYSNSKYSPSLSRPNLTNLSQVKWNINWREIFGGRTGDCRVRVRVLSSSSTVISWANNTGTVRASFQSNNSNSTNGFNLGYVRPQSDYTSGTANTTYLDVDTTTSNGTTIAIPNTNNDFYIMFLDKFEQFMTNMPDYQVWLYFDVDDEDPLLIPNSDTSFPTIYNPR